MSDLYRIASGYDKIETDIGRLLYDLATTDVLVKVEPCVHGKYDGHWGPRLTGPGNDPEIQVRNWCRGAAIGGRDE